MKKKRHFFTRKKFLFLLFILIAFVGLWFSTSAPYQPEQSKPAELFSNQTSHDLRQLFVAGINGSQRSVLLIIYSLNDPFIIKSLKTAAKKGIKVDVVCDPKASPGLQKKLGSKVKVHNRFSSGLMHQKILVSDEAKIWIGSANLTADSLRSHGNLVTALHSSEMADAIYTKAKALMTEDKDLLVPHCHYNVGGQRVELCFFPDDKQGAQRLVQLIRSAQKTIRVAMFTWTREDLASAILDAQKRGVHTDIILDYHTAKGASAKVFEILKTGGIPIRLGQAKSLCHHKFVYIDGKTLVNGSANWTKAAFTKNDDCFIILHDLNYDQQKRMEDLWVAIKADSVEG